MEGLASGQVPDKTDAYYLGLVHIYTSRVTKGEETK